MTARLDQAAPPPPLREDLWGAIEPIYGAILRHPFLSGLADGGLDRNAFARYVTQDAHYVRGYARALAGLSARAPREADVQLFARHAAAVLAGEQELHESLLAELGAATAEAGAGGPSPTGLAYTSYLQATVHTGSFAEALGAVLPCYWVYARVGAALRERGSRDALYGRWIAAYGGDEFAAVVDEVLDVVDRVGAELGAAERAGVRDACTTSARYEWMFWDAAYRDERWPLGQSEGLPEPRASTNARA